MADGYTPEDINRAFGRIYDAYDVRLLCVWEYADAYGFGGNSECYVEDECGTLHELGGHLWPWLNGDIEAPADPGDPTDWTAARADLPVELPCEDGFHNAALAISDDD